MLQARGLQLVRHVWHMQIDLVAGFQQDPTLAGIEISGIDPRVDLPAVHAVLDEVFADRWVTIRSRWPGGSSSRRRARATIRRSGCWPRREGSRWAPSPAPVSEDQSSVDQLGVLAPARARGIGAALLRRSFAMFAGRGLGRALRSVDAENPTGATRL
jgi:mycothiol synthase